MTTVSITWPSVHLLRLAPVGDTPPEVFGLRWVMESKAGEPDASYAIDDPHRVRMLCDTFKALSPILTHDQRKVADGAVRRLRGALVNSSMA